LSASLPAGRRKLLDEAAAEDWSAPAFAKTTGSGAIFSYGGICGEGWRL